MKWLAGLLTSCCACDALTPRVYLAMGIVIGSAVFPVAAALTWKKCSAKAAITSSVVAMPLGIMTWWVQ